MLVHMIGNAHIDPVWLWPWQAGADEALATMSSAADRCDEYPEFIFTRGEAWLYQQVEKLHPELFKRIRKHVERGQWHITGGQFLQPDLNLPTEAGLHRQIVHGQRYFRDRFGIAPTTGYNVDSFGHTASLPDILVAHGYTGYVFRRPEQHQVPLPANTFVWRGVKGGEVIAFRISPGYVANFAELTGQVKIAIESADPAIGHTMCFYGVGNHGGGPSKAMIEWIIAHRHSFEGHELIFSTPQAFMDAIADKRDRLPRVSVELQHTFPGCYSVMHDIKSAQRHGEHLLDQAEHAAVAFASDEAERRSSLARIEQAWDDLLFTEFHDILTGTSIPSAWGSVRAMQGRARIAAEEVLFEVTRRWSYRVLPRVNEHQIIAINTHDAPFRGFVEAEPYLDFDDWRGRWLCDERGKSVRFQEIQPESNQLIPRILFPAEIAADWRPPVPGAQRSAPQRNRSARNAITASKRQLSNGLLAISLGAGGISQIALRGVNLLGRGGIGLHLRHDSTDTWTFHTDRWAEAVEARLGGGAWQVEESGPLRGRVRMDARLRNSRVTWTVSLYEGEPRVEIDLVVNFDERFTLLQMPVRLAEPALALGRRHRRRPRRAFFRPDRVAVPGLVAPQGRQDRHRTGHERCLQSQRERAALAADAAAQPEDGLGRRPAGHLFGPRSSHRPGRARLSLRAPVRSHPQGSRPCSCGSPPGAAARRLRSLRGHGPAGLGAGAAARPLGTGHAAQRGRGTRFGPGPGGTGRPLQAARHRLFRIGDRNGTYFRSTRRTAEEAPDRASAMDRHRYRFRSIAGRSTEHPGRSASPGRRVKVSPGFNIRRSRCHRNGRSSVRGSTSISAAKALCASTTPIAPRKRSGSIPTTNVSR